MVINVYRKLALLTDNCRKGDKVCSGQWVGIGACVNELSITARWDGQWWWRHVLQRQLSHLTPCEWRHVILRTTAYNTRWSSHTHWQHGPYYETVTA